MLFIIRAVVLWGSLFGYCAFLKKYITPAFTPIFTVSTIGVLLFVAGLLNVMLVSTLLIVLGGWLCLIQCKLWNKEFLKNHRESFAIFGIFSAICCIFLLRVYNQIPTHYDCFSHWLTVVRDMLKTNHMPNFKSSMISFQGYPTGSAGFIYFICKVLGNSRDDLILFSQSILYAASLTVFAAFIKRRGIIGVLIAVAGSLFCITAQSMALEHLLVDTLISLLSIGVVAILIYYRHQPMSGVLLSLPLQLFLVAVKNSGIIMVALNFTLVIALVIAADYTAKRKVSVLNLIKLGGITAGVPAVLYYLWMQHVEYVFQAGTTTKHTTSLENYMETFSNKTGEQVKEILQVFIKRFVSWNNAWLLLIIVFAIILIGWLIKKYVLKRHSKSEFFIFLGIMGAYLIFMAVLGTMYLLSMPYGESIVLAAYDRYEKTILVYIMGVTTIYALSLTSLLPGFKKEGLMKLLILLSISSTLLLQTKNVQVFAVKADRYTNSSRFDFEQLKSNYAIEEGKRYFIYGSRFENDAGYHYFLTRYLFWSQSICLCTPENFDSSKNNIGQYDYLIIVDRDQQINDFLSSYNVDTTRQVYTIKGVFE